MGERYNLPQTDPDGFKALLQLESFIQAAEWLAPFSYLIKIRVSQINGCAYCTNMHTNAALKAGELPARIESLGAWSHEPAFSEKEKMVIELAETVTILHPRGLSNDLYEKALHWFTSQEIARIIMAAATTQLWNRVVISSGIGV